jgi:hypothetical protein
MTSINNSDAGTIQSRQNGAPSEVRLIIHHQFPGVELVSPAYISTGATCCLSPDQSVDVGSIMQAGFNIDPDQESIGILMYKLQRKGIDQSNEEATCIQLVVIWKVNSSKEFCVVSHLIEHDKDRIWDRDGLMRLTECYELFNIQHGSVEDTWLMRDNTVLMASLNVVCKEYYKLEMTISETSIKDDTQRLWYIGLDR